MRWRTYLLAAVMISVAFVCAGIALDKGKRNKMQNQNQNKLSILLVPAGNVDDELLHYLQSTIPKYIPSTISISPRERITDYAYDASRHQYLASMLALSVAKRAEHDHPTSLLVVTNVDIYEPGVNFLFGLAMRQKRIAIISISRLDPAFYGLAPNPAKTKLRALKEALHELGHLLGLEHCPNPRCVMHFSNSLSDTDLKGPDFCPLCKKQIEQYLSALRSRSQ